jgi:hypothetical protein
MNSPNETPNFGREAMPMLVGWGSQMLPGPVVCGSVRHKLYGKRNTMLTLDKPSIKMTAMSKKEDAIPSIEAMESNESGKNTAGKNLVKGRQHRTLRDRKPDEHNQAENFINVSGICRCYCFY